MKKIYQLIIEYDANADKVETKYFYKEEEAIASFKKMRKEFTKESKVRYPEWDGVDEYGLKTENEAVREGLFCYEEVSLMLETLPYDGTGKNNIVYILSLDSISMDKVQVFDTPIQAIMFAKDMVMGEKDITIHIWPEKVK